MDGVAGVQTNTINANRNQTQATQSSVEFLQALLSSLTMLENPASDVNSSLPGADSTSVPGILLPLELLACITGGSGPLVSDAGKVISGSELNQNVSQRPVSGLGGIVAQASALYHVPASLIHGVIQQESGNDPNSVSSAGAMGLMQLMPENLKSLGVSDPFDPVQNVMAGTRLLAGLLERYKGNASLALAAYNAGAGAVEKYNGIPPYPETQQYVQKVLNYADQYAATGNVGT